MYRFIDSCTHARVNVLNAWACKSACIFIRENSDYRRDCMSFAEGMSKDLPEFYTCTEFKN